MTAVAPFQHSLRLCRRRLRSISISQHIVMAASVAVLISGAAVALGGFPRDFAMVLGGSLLALGVIAGTWLGIHRTPSIVSVAAVVDRRLGLHDSTVTALECVGSADPVSALVVRDANALTHQITPAALFGYSLLPYTKPLGAAALVMTVLASMRIGEPAASNTGQGIRVPVASSEGGKTAPGADRSARAQATGEAETRRGSNVGSAEAPRESARSASVAQSAVTSSTESRPDSAAAQGREATGRGSAPTPGASAAMPQGDATEAAHAASSGRGGAGAARDGGRGGSTPGAVDARSAGGVRGQRAGGEPPSTALRRGSARIGEDLDTLSPRSYAARYELAARQAEEALSAGRVPPHLRAYVRRYFNGIRPDRHP